MPLLIPGLDEVSSKTLAKRLHKSLKKQENAPTLTQVQTLLVQAVGHADWHAAQTYWQRPVSTARVPYRTSEDKMTEAAREYFDAFPEVLMRYSVLTRFFS